MSCSVGFREEEDWNVSVRDNKYMHQNDLSLGNLYKKVL